MPYLILDLEMSGTEAGFHDIIQIGAVLSDNEWNKIGEFESLVYPENEDAFSTSAEEIHGISIYDLEEAPMAYEVFEDLEKWLRRTLRRQPNDALRDVVMCGQSVINDINFLKIKYSELNVDWPFSGRLLDLVSITTLMNKVNESNGKQKPAGYSLTAVAGFFQLKREDELHNALEDASLTYLCFKKYFELAAKLKFMEED